MISIIIPTRNESQNIHPLLERFHQLPSFPHEIIFIDASSDNTFEIISQLIKDHSNIQAYKQQSKGKAQSIIEATNYASSETIVMIDADLQYPPEAIPDMIEKSKSADVIVARRSQSNETLLRRIPSKIHELIFGRLLFGLTCDIQSGLKLFPKNIIKHLDPQDISPWTLDLALLLTAQKLGYTISEVPIQFHERHAGQSKVSILNSTREHTISALKMFYKYRWKSFFASLRIFSSSS